MNTILKNTVSMAALCSVSMLAEAAVIDFHFTGNLAVADGGTGLILNNDSIGNDIVLTPIAATLSYDTATGLGGSDLSITMDAGFWSSPATFHDISLQHVGGDTINGLILVDWMGNNNMPMHVSWDAAGLFNAIDIGLGVGDTISGTILKQDTTGNGVFDTFTDVGSATPYSDDLIAGNLYYSSISPLEGQAPLAATSASLGLGYDINGNYIGGTPFDGIRGLLNIGSGNSLTVTGVAASVVPIPAAVWLFGSGLLGLMAVARRKIRD